MEVATQLVLAFVTSRLDYCNSVLAGLPQVTLEPLQRVQNAAARLILDLNWWEHVTRGLGQLHWYLCNGAPSISCVPSGSPYIPDDVQST
jgi:hypothetical protein